MLSPETWAMIGREMLNTLYMAGFSTLFGYVLGLPWGIVLAVTGSEGIRPNKVVYRVLDIITNIMRSIPFLILLILIIPLTRLIVGKSYGSTATIVPNGRVLPQGSGSRRDRSRAGYGSGYENDHHKGSSCRSKDLSDRRRHDLLRDHPRLFRYGGYSRRRRSRRRGDPVRLLPLPVRYYDRHSHSSGRDRADFPVCGHETCISTGQKEGLRDNIEVMEHHARKRRSSGVQERRTL